MTSSDIWSVYRPLGSLRVPMTRPFGFGRSRATLSRNLLVTRRSSINLHIFPRQMSWSHAVKIGQSKCGAWMVCPVFLSIPYLLYQTDPVSKRLCTRVHLFGVSQPLRMEISHPAQVMVSYESLQETKLDMRRQSWSLPMMTPTLNTRFPSRLSFYWLY